MHSYFFCCFCFTNWGRICNFFLLLFSFGIFLGFSKENIHPCEGPQRLPQPGPCRREGPGASDHGCVRTHLEHQQEADGAPRAAHGPQGDELKICLRENGLSENPPTFMDGRIPKLQSGQLALANLQANLPGSQKGNGKNGGKKPAAATSRRQLALIKSPSGNLVCFN